MNSIGRNDEKMKEEKGEEKKESSFSLPGMKPIQKKKYSKTYEMTSSHLFSTRWFQGRLPGVGCQGNLFPFPKIEEKWKERGEKKNDLTLKLSSRNFLFWKVTIVPFAHVGDRGFHLQKSVLTTWAIVFFPVTSPHFSRIIRSI